MKARASNLIVTLLAVFLWKFADAALTDETVDLRVFNPDFQASDSEMMELLKKADLENHGYKKEVITKLVSEPDSDKPSYQKMYFLYKIVDCSKLAEIEQELATLMPGVLGLGLTSKFNHEATRRGIDSMTWCKAGIEVHFKEGSGSCGDKQKSRRKKRNPCWICSVCYEATGMTSF